MSGPGSHHTAFLLAILIGILLLLFVACVLLLCHCRDKCHKFGRHGRKTRIIDRLTREQATSMTCISLNYQGPPSLSFYGSQLAQNTSCRLIGCSIQFAVQEDNENSNTTVTNSTTYHSQQGTFAHPDVIHTEPHSKEKQESEVSIHGSVSRRMFSSCPSIMESALRNVMHLEFPSVEKPSSGRCSSSLNSRTCLDILLDLQESTIPDASCLTNHLETSRQEPWSAISKTSSHPQFVCCSSTLTSTTVSRNSLYVLTQQNEHSELQIQSKHSDSFSVPNTLKRPSLAAENLESNAQTRQYMAPLPKPYPLLPPISWFIFLGNTSASERTTIAKKDTNNVASVDSGVDVVELQNLRVCAPEEKGVQKTRAQKEMLIHLGNPETKARCDCEIEQLHSSGPRKQEHTWKMENCECESEQPTVHTETAVSLHQVNSGNKRSLWQQWEETPLIGIN